MEWWLLSVLCLTGLILLFLEVFIPSGGVLAIAAVLCIGYSIWELWIQDYQFLAVICVAFTVLYTVILFKLWVKKFGLKSKNSVSVPVSMAQILSEMTFVHREHWWANEGW